MHPPFRVIMVKIYGIMLLDICFNLHTILKNLCTVAPVVIHCTITIPKTRESSDRFFGKIYLNDGGMNSLGVVDIFGAK